MTNEKEITSDGKAKNEIETILDCLDWDIMVINKNFDILFANKKLLEKIKITRNEAMAQHCYEITHHIDRPCQSPNDICPLEKMFETGHPTLETHTHFDKNGEGYLANTITAPLESFGQDAYLHLSIPVKDVGTRKEETETALDKTLGILKIIGMHREKVQDLNNKKTELEGTKKELESKIEELEKFRKLTVEREMRMIELKQKCDWKGSEQDPADAGRT